MEFSGFSRSKDDDEEDEVVPAAAPLVTSQLFSAVAASTPPRCDEDVLDVALFHGSDPGKEPLDTAIPPETRSLSQADRFGKTPARAVAGPSEEEKSILLLEASQP